MGLGYALHFLFTKSHKIVKILKTTKAREKIRTYLESLEFLKFFDVCLTKFKNNPIFINKITHSILLPTKLFIG